MSEAYDSDAESSSSSVPPETIRKEAVVNSADYDDDEEEQEEPLDWDTVVSKLRASVLDRSKKRRSVFVNRYLAVKDNCEHAKLDTHAHGLIVQLLHLAMFPLYSRHCYRRCHQYRCPTTLTRSSRS